MTEKDALEELFVEEDAALNTEVLRDLLVEYVQLSKEGKVFILPSFNKITNKKKMLIILLARKALALKLEQEELTSPKEIQEITELTKGTVNPTLRVLVEERLVREEKGKYKVPNYAVHKIKELFEKKGDGNER